MAFFDYVFFRLYTFYLAKEKNGSPVFTSVLYLSFIQIVLVYLVIGIYFVTTKDYFDILETVRGNKSTVKLMVVVFGVLLEAANYFRYADQKRREKVISRYRANRLNQSLEVWMLIPLVAFLIFLPFILSRVIKIF